MTAARFDPAPPTAIQAATALRIAVLGPLRVTRGADNLTPAGDVARRVVTAVAARAGEELTSDELVQLVYSCEATRALRKRLQSVVYRLRSSVLGASHVLLTTDRGYVLTAVPGTVDVEEFERLARSGRELLHANAPHDAVGVLRVALDLWRGPPLADLPESEHFAGTVARLIELRGNTIEDWAEAALATGRALPAIDELERLVSAQPTRERAWAMVIHAWAAAGRHETARRGYEQACRHLADAGLEPGVDLEAAGAATRTVGAVRHLLRDAAEAAPAAAAFPAALRAALDRGPLIGRVQELEQGRDAISSALERSEARLLLVSGEAGIGKTRLAAELARRAGDAGAAVWLGQCDPYLRVPYSPFVQIARDLLRRDPPVDARRRLAGPLAYFAPDLVADDARRVARDPETERYLLFEDVSALLLDTAAPVGAVLVIDDLHWAPTATLLLLAHLLRAAESAPLLVIATYRDTETALSREHDELIRALEQLPGACRMPLGGLGRDELLRLVGGGRSGPASARWSVDELERLTAGNPLYAIGLARRGTPDGADAAGESLASGFRRVVDGHLAHLPAPATWLIETLAVLGDDADVGLVITVAGAVHDELATADVSNVVDQAVAAGVVQRIGRAADRVAFTHGVVREAVYEGTPQGRRQQLHLAAGAALEAGATPRQSPLVHELARHFQRAGALCDPRRRAVWSRAAGDDAARALAFDDAARWYGHALDALDAVADPDDADRFEVLLALGRMREELGEYEPGDAAFTTAAELAEAMGSPDRLALAALHHGGSWVRSRPHDRHKARALLHAAQESLGDASGLRGAVEARLEIADEATRTTVRWPSHDIASAFGRDATLAVLAERWFYELGEARLEVARLLVARAGMLGDTTAFAIGLIYEWIARLSLGQATLHDPVQEDIASRMDQVASPHARWIWDTWQAGLVASAGRRADGERMIQSAHERALLAPVTPDERPASPGFLVAVRNTQLLLLYFNHGRYAEMGQLLDGMPSIWAARLFDVELVDMVLTARRGGAPSNVERIRHLVDEVGDHPGDPTAPPRLAMLAIAAADLGDAGSARALSRALEPLRGTRVMFIAAFCGATVDHYLGRLAITMDEPERAVELLEVAEEQHEWFGSPVYTTFARFWRSHALRRLGGTRRVAEADRLLGAVREAAERNDMPQFLA